MTEAARDALLAAAAICSAIVVLATAAWWLIGPRVKASLTELIEASKEARDELQLNRPGSTARHAAEAAEHARELPALRGQVNQLRRELHDIVEARVVERLGVVEAQTDSHNRQIGRLQDAVIELIGAPRTQRRKDDDT